jgi:hypothetical protein
VTLLLDAGALIAIERFDRDVIALIKRERRDGRVPITHGGVVGQVWRGGRGRQANLARFLPSVEIRPLDDALGRRAGILLGESQMSDVVDAALALLASDGDDLLTTDPDDLVPLVEATGKHVEIVAV